MTTVAKALREAALVLQSSSDTARLDAELLMAHALGVNRSELLIRHMNGTVPDAFPALLARRAAHEPVAQIVGLQEFYGRSFAVNRHVLIPRGDSETLVRAALERCPGPRRVLDLGTGSGALLLTILCECPRAEGIGLDRSMGALAIAQTNAAALGLDERACFLELDWTKGHWAEGLGSYDLVLANPPYVADEAQLAPSVLLYEPAEALFAGPDGLDDYRLILPELPRLLAPGGVAVVEIGAEQAGPVVRLAADHGLSCEHRHDLAGRARALVMELALGNRVDPE